MTPVVSVLVAHHLNENQPYLDLCLKALTQTTGIEIEILCIADTKEPPKVPDGVFLHHRPDLDLAGSKFNWGVKYSNPSSRYVMLVSDDVVVSRHAIAQMVESIGNLALICNPVSNGEVGTRILTKMVVGGVHLRPDMSMEDVAGIEDKLMDVYTDGILVRQNDLGFYATLIPRAVWNAVGELDLALDARHNDNDYCIRASKMGIPCFLHTGAFALHFGSKTIYKSFSKEYFDNCTQTFQKKWNLG